MPKDSADEFMCFLNGVCEEKSVNQVF